MKKALLLPLAASIALPAAALPPMHPEGFHGTVNVGAAFGEIESNFLAKIDGFGVDLGDETINTFGAPDAEDIVMPMARFDIGWTFGNNKTRLSLGNDFTDLLEFDRTTRLSLRHDFDSLGQVRVDALQPTGFATQVWRDPYQLNTKRSRTDQEISGGRLVWDKMFGTGLGIQLSAKNKDIDKEESGFNNPNLTPQERRLLDREGDIYYAELNYNYRVDEWHVVVPKIAYHDQDLDGDAMSQKGVMVGVDHFYRGQNVEWGTQLQYASVNGDERNPIFGQTNNSDGFSFTTLIVFPGAFDFMGKWAPNIQATFVEEDSDVDFNDSSIWTVGVGIGRQF